MTIVDSDEIIKILSDKAQVQESDIALGISIAIETIELYASEIMNGNRLLSRHEKINFEPLDSEKFRDLKKAIEESSNNPEFAKNLFNELIREFEFEED